MALAGDITDPVHRRVLADAAGGWLDLLILNAGTLGPSPLPRVADLVATDLRATLETNVVAQVELLQVVLPALRRAAGTVVVVTSDAAVEAYPGWGAYGASKAALDRLAAVLASEEPALRVYSIDPGDLRTDMHQAAFPGEDISDRPLPEAVVPAVLAILARRPDSGRYSALAELQRDAV
jgi:NAD(P)-dependent dehydrogenase (short-subunit alcohol dehydrogenase family)